jgi:hypothetical protein
MSLWKTFTQNCAALSLNCREASRAQSDALEAPLPPAKRVGLWIHLLLCKWCRRYGRQLRLLHCAAHEHAAQLAETGPEKLPADARARIKQRLQEEQDTNSTN